MQRMRDYPQRLCEESGCDSNEAEMLVGVVVA